MSDFDEQYYKDSFLPKAITLAKREHDCMNYSMQQSANRLKEDDLGGAAVHLENAARSLHELQRLKNERSMAEEARELLQRLKEDGD